MTDDRILAKLRNALGVAALPLLASCGWTISAVSTVPVPGPCNGVSDAVVVEGLCPYYPGGRPPPPGAMCSLDDPDHRDFHGPADITIRVEPEVDSGRRNLDAVIHFTAAARGRDKPRFYFGEFPRVRLYTAPVGTTIGDVSSLETILTHDARFGGVRGPAEYGSTCSAGAPIPSHWYDVAGPLVARVDVVGDTSGDDISTDENCRCDTRIDRIRFNQVSVPLVRADGSCARIPVPEGPPLPDPEPREPARESVVAGIDGGVCADPPCTVPGTSCGFEWSYRPFGASVGVFTKDGSGRCTGWFPNVCDGGFIQRFMCTPNGDGTVTIDQLGPPTMCGGRRCGVYPADTMECTGAARPEGGRCY